MSLSNKPINNTVVYVSKCKFCSKKLSCLGYLPIKNRPQIIPSETSDTFQETPWCTSSKGEKASYTIEAAVVLTVFLCITVFAMFFMRIIQVSAGVQQALDETARKIAVACNDNEDKASNAASATAYCYFKIKDNKTPTGYINGIINFTNSELDNNYIDLVADYKIRFPIAMFGKKDFHITQRAKTRKWIGFDPNENSESDQISNYVYVTENGTVFHRNRHCTYLNPSIQIVNYEAVKNLRNDSGHKYYSCPSCKVSLHSNYVYITDYGESYHSTVSCSGLKRTIYKITEEEAKSKYGPCSKCG